MNTNTDTNRRCAILYPPRFTGIPRDTAIKFFLKKSCKHKVFTYNISSCLKGTGMMLMEIKTVLVYMIRAEVHYSPENPYRRSEDKDSIMKCSNPRNECNVG